MLQETRLTAYSHGGGCACKLGIAELDEILGHLPPVRPDARVLVGLDAPDDAGVFRVSDDLALVQTVDFFTPIVDDPYDWGRIAAVNALSDVYAMGGAPVSALNLAAWPRDLDFALLGKVLEGAGDACADAGVAVVGGHSIDDAEPKFGLAVTGTVHPERFVAKTTATGGEDLVLSKPLGTGIITHAIKAGTAPRDVVESAVKTMGTLNRGAAEAMLDVGVTAATDVTGFGLLGHLAQMLGDRLDAELRFDDIPIITGVGPLAAAGTLPGGSVRNREATSPRVDPGPVSETNMAILYDAQTAGGLLMAVAPDRTAALLEAMRQREALGVVIGRLDEGSGRTKVTTT
ncbi:MAG: selenide, water dikinase SelD [Actinobacteria bacterium]|nr:selenide, water dikinase SelD [Actinomycetota bacterium]